jgi:integration host factor subunit beta
MSLTKLELSSRISKKIKMPASDVKSVIETFISELLLALASGERVELRGFGAFSIKHRKARTGRNPRNGVEVAIPEHDKPVFRFSREGELVFSEEQAKIVKPTV